MFISTPAITVCAFVYAVQISVVAALLVHLRHALVAAHAAIGVDPLTGLLNRRGLLSRMAADPSCGVMLLDLARFKDINDRWGHDVGDDLLVRVADGIAAVAHDVLGVAGRLGGDEFVLLIPDHPSQARLAEVAQSIHHRLAEPITLPSLAEPLSVGVVIGAAPASVNPLPGKPFRAADVALYHARRHRQPYALYRPGMVHPAAEDRHGERLRDRRTAPEFAVFDRPLFDRLMTAQVSSDVAHLDDLAELADLIEVLDPSGRDFGTDAADLLHRALTHGVIRLTPPLCGATLSPTVLGETRDGGFLVLAHITNTITLASTRVHPRQFTGTGPQLAHRLLTVITHTLNQLHDTYQACPRGGHPR